MKKTMKTMRKKTKAKKKKRNQNQENKEGEPEPVGRSRYPLLILLFWIFFQVCYYPVLIPLLYPLFLPLLPPGMPPLFPDFLCRPYIPRIKKRSKNGKKSKKNRKNRKKKPRRKPDHIQNCKNVAILAVNWTGGFLLSNNGTFNSAAFRKLLKLREREHPDVPIAIHGFWLILKRNGRNVRRPKSSITKDDILAAEDELREYLERNPGKVGYLHIYWPDLCKWSPIVWEKEPLAHNWVLKRFQFRIIVLEFLCHGRPMGLTLSKYIERTIEEFDRIMLSQIIQNSSHFPTSTGREFSLGFNYIRFTDGMHLISDIENSLGKRPLLLFRKYESPVYGIMCCLSEFKFAFNLAFNGQQEVEFTLQDQPSDTKCNGHHGLPLSTPHRCVVLSHHDRWTRVKD